MIRPTLIRFQCVGLWLAAFLVSLSPVVAQQTTPVVAMPRTEKMLSASDTIVVVTDTLHSIVESTEVPPLKHANHVHKEFSPSPTKAIWMAALLPGLGQIYNRKYWKLPIVYGGFVGVLYGFNWNNQNLADYSQAYSDLLSGDPNRKSYLDLLPAGTTESSVDKNWLEQVLKRGKDNFRRNRDLCVIGMVGLYALSIIDAYVDASLFHFDINTDLSMKVVPTVIPQSTSLQSYDPRQNAYGVRLAFLF